MKKLISLIISLLLITGVFWGCASQSQQIREYTDPNQTIEIGVGNQFVIALESNPTTGYKWDANFDSSSLKLVKSDYEQSEAKPGMVGVGGKEHFTFEGLKKGNTKVTLDYKREWEQDSAEQMIFNVSVK